MSERKKSEPTFGNDALKKALGQWKQEVKRAEPPPKPRVVSKASAAPPPKATHPSDDSAMFRAAMEDVVPIRRSPGGAEPQRIERTPQEVDEDAEAFARLTELVTSGDGMDIADTDEYIEGLAIGADRGLLDRLRRGDFSFHRHLDLHGLLAVPAKEALERFLIESRRQGHRCVLVVHGRGLHSKDQTPVLKSRIGTWLSRGQLARIVLAFATARPVDGGAGALYVLLRR